MLRENQRRRGRFIKKDSKVAKSVLLQDFSFSEINTVKVINHDNPLRSIIHTTYHDLSSVKDAARDPPQFNDDLTDERDRRPILVPLDFTVDWERSKDQRRNRVFRSDDEDDFDYEAAMRAARSKANSTNLEPESLVKTELENSATGSFAQASATPNKNDSDKVEVTASSADEAVAVMQAAGFKFAKTENRDQIQELTEENLQSSDLLETDEDQSIVQEVSQADNGVESEFIPMADGEHQATEEYHRRSARRQIDEKVIAEIEEEAKARGYREGFGLGEEKGIAIARQNAAALFGKVSELVHELDGLQKNILDLAQQNFYEICQAMAEALFKREFTIHPDSFVTVIRKAIDEAADSQKVRVRVHPDMYNRIAQLGIKDLESTLIKDPSVELTDFRVESEQSVIEGNLSKIVRDFLNQADLNIVESISNSSDQNEKQEAS